MVMMSRLINRLATREEGQTLVEYSLILAMLSIGSIAVLLALSGKINDVFTTISGAL
jgi:Flp pilus assembly pilin Flp